MSSKRLMLGGGALLSVAAVVAMIVPTSRQHVLGILRGEARLNDKYVSQWVDDLGSENVETRHEAAANLGNFGTPGRAALPELARVLRDDMDAQVRCAAAFAIFKISSDVKRQGVHANEILDVLISSLTDSVPLVRMNVALALGTLEADARPALPELQAAIKRKENKVKVLTFTLTIREQMIVAIGFMGPDGKDALGLLEEALRDDSEATRAQAARTLGKLGPDAKHAVPLLIEAINDEAESEHVQESAREAVKLIDPDAAAKLVNK